MAFQQSPDRRSVRRTRVQFGTVLLLCIIAWALYINSSYHRPQPAANLTAHSRHVQQDIAKHSMGENAMQIDGARRDAQSGSSGLREAGMRLHGSSAAAAVDLYEHTGGSLQPDTTEALCEPHNKCVFVVSTGRSGSTNLQDALNQIPGVFVRGENLGLFQQVQRLSGVVGKVMKEAEADFALEHIRPRVAADAKEEYEQYVAAQLKTAWVNSWPKGSPQCTASLIFKQLYGAGVFRDYIVGFKEVRYNSRSGITSYGELQWHLDFLRGLCKDARIVLNMRRDVKATARSGHFRGSMSQEWERLLAEEVGWFQKYAAARPEGTMVMYYEDMFDAAKNQTLAEDLLQFIGVDRVEINFGRQKGWWAYPKKRGL